MRASIGSPVPYRIMLAGSKLMPKLGRAAVRELRPMQPGDVPASFADVDALSDAVGFRPDTPIEEGVRRFCDWFRETGRQFCD